MINLFKKLIKEQKYFKALFILKAIVTIIGKSKF